MSTNNTAVYMVQAPVELPFGIGLLLESREDALPQSIFAPAIEASRDSLPLAIALRQITPWSTRSENLEDAIDDTAVVKTRTPNARFLSRHQGLQTLPLGVGQLTTTVN